MLSLLCAFAEVLREAWLSTQISISAYSQGAFQTSVKHPFLCIYMGSGMEMTTPIPFPGGNIPKCQAVTSSDCLSCQLSHFPKCRQELAG